MGDAGCPTPWRVASIAPKQARSRGASCSEPDRPVYPLARAVFSYKAVAENDVTLWLGEEVKVIEGGPERNWWLVQVIDRGGIGLAPSNYLELLPVQQSQRPSVIALQPRRHSQASPTTDSNPPTFSSCVERERGLAVVIRAKVEAGQISEAEAEHISQVALTVRAMEHHEMSAKWTTLEGGPAMASDADGLAPIYEETWPAFHDDREVIYDVLPPLSKTATFVLEKPAVDPKWRVVTPPSLLYDSLRVAML